MSEFKKTPRLNGYKVVQQTLFHGLKTDGLLVGGPSDEDIVKFSFAGRECVILRHPDYVDHVLHAGVDNYRKSIEYEMLRAALGLSLFTDEGDSWRRHRMTLNPVMAKRHLPALYDLMMIPIERFMSELDDGSDRIELEMSHGMTELTLDVVGSALFGRGMADLADRIGADVVDALRIAEVSTRLLMVSNVPRWTARGIVEVIKAVPFLPPPIGHAHEVLKEIDTTVWDVINERRRQPGRDDDLLGLLLSVRDEDGEPLPLRRVRDEAATFMLAGHETTANAMSWMWYLLALNTDARDRMLAEVDEVLGGEQPAFEDIPKLEWTTACFMEAMRMFSPAWILPRTCVTEDVIDGHRIKQGSTVIMPANSLHHDERFWPEPDVFKPERFLPENAKAHHRSAYMPFGGGKRVCAGKSFAVIEGTMITAMMSQRFVFDLVPAYPIEIEALFTLRPKHGLPMIARRRATAARREDLAVAA